MTQPDSPDDAVPPPSGAADPIARNPADQNSPEPPEPASRWLTYLLLDPLIAILTSFFGCVSLVASCWDASGRQQHAIATIWARCLLRVTNSPVTVEWEGGPPLQGAAVYACNHLSYMDTPVLFSSLPFQFRIFAKQSLWKVPFIGWHLKRSGQVPVDQSTARGTVASLNRGVATLRSGMPLLLFPEGGRSPDGWTKSFLPGAAFMAIRAQVPLVPVTLVGTHELLPMHVYALRPRPLKLIIGEAIPTHHLTTRDAEHLTAKAFSVITSTYMEESST